MSMDRVLRILSFGDRLVPYDRALALQKQLWASRHAGECLDTLITLQVRPSRPFDLVARAEHSLSFRH